MKTIKPCHDSAGDLIREHDVLRDDHTGEMAIVTYSENNAGVKGLCIQNPVIGSGDWLDVFPDGVWTIVGNLAVTGEE